MDKPGYTWGQRQWLKKLLINELEFLVLQNHPSFDVWRGDYKNTQDSMAHRLQASFIYSLFEKEN